MASNWLRKRGSGPPDGMQRLLNPMEWDTDAVRDDPAQAEKEGTEAKRAAELARERLPITAPEVRRLVYRLIWQPPPQPERILRWSTWRRRRQQRAKRSHYQRRTTQLRL